MWLLISIPMVLIFTIVSGYLQRTRYMKRKRGVNIKKNSS